MDSASFGLTTLPTKWLGGGVGAGEDGRGLEARGWGKGLGLGGSGWKET